MVGSEVFLRKPKHQCHLSHWVKKAYAPNHEKNGDYYANPCLSQLTDKI